MRSGSVRKCDSFRHRYFANESWSPRATQSITVLGMRTTNIVCTSLPLTRCNVHGSQVASNVLALTRVDTPVIVSPVSGHTTSVVVTLAWNSKHTRSMPHASSNEAQATTSPDVRNRIALRRARELAHAATSAKIRALGMAKYAATVSSTAWSPAASGMCPRRSRRSFFMHCFATRHVS